MEDNYLKQIFKFQSPDAVAETFGNHVEKLTYKFIMKDEDITRELAEMAAACEEFGVTCNIVTDFQDGCRATKIIFLSEQDRRIFKYIQTDNEAYLNDFTYSYIDYEGHEKLAGIVKDYLRMRGIKTGHCVTCDGAHQFKFDSLDDYRFFAQLAGSGEMERIVSDVAHPGRRPQDLSRAAPLRLPPPENG